MDDYRVSPSSGAPGELPEGTRVKIMGCDATPEYIGRTGKVSGWMDGLEGQPYMVELDGAPSGGLTVCPLCRADQLMVKLPKDPK